MTIPGYTIQGQTLRSPNTWTQPGGRKNKKNYRSKAILYQFSVTVLWNLILVRPIQIGRIINYFFITKLILISVHNVHCKRRVQKLWLTVYEFNNNNNNTRYYYWLIYIEQQQLSFQFHFLSSTLPQALHFRFALWPQTTKSLAAALCALPSKSLGSLAVLAGTELGHVRWWLGCVTLQPLFFSTIAKFGILNTTK